MQRAFGLALPLLAFILVLFVYPITTFLTQAFYDARFATLMPETTKALTDWDAISEPTEEMAAILVADLIVARKDKTIGKVATRVLTANYRGHAACSPKPRDPQRKWKRRTWRP